jgi:hypothetical protein
MENRQFGGTLEIYESFGQDESYMNQSIDLLHTLTTSVVDHTDLLTA